MKFDGSSKGSILVVLLFLCIMIAMIGAWSLSSVQKGVSRSGHYRGALALLYQAEEGLQKAIQRFQMIVDPIQTDSLFSSGLYGGGDPTNEMTLLNLLAIDQPSAIASEPGLDAACAEPFDPTIDLNVVPSQSNVLCNFMGTSLSSTQVILVRKNDHVEGLQQYAIFLMNVISRDATGRRQIVQGIISLAYLGSGPSATIPANQNAKLIYYSRGGID